jgi:hypothetical protein
VRGRATGVALPALVVLAFVAVVAIASTGSTPGGSGETRPPSESLLDTLFTLGLVGVAVGGALLVYGLTQRKAIGRELASGRYRRGNALAVVCFFSVLTAFAYWGLDRWRPREGQVDEEYDFAFPGRAPVPTTPDGQQTASYEPGIAWLPIAVVVGLLVAGVVAYVVSERRAKRAGRPGEDLAEQLAVVLDETLDDLRAETDPRRAIIAAYAQLERVLAANGVPRHAAETPDEYLPRVLRDLALTPDGIRRLTALFTEARFSQHVVDIAMKEEAIGALEQVRDELRVARERQPAELDAALVPAGSDA